MVPARLANALAQLCHRGQLWQPIVVVVVDVEIASECGSVLVVAMFVLVVVVLVLVPSMADWMLLSMVPSTISQSRTAISMVYWSSPAVAVMA